MFVTIFHSLLSTIPVKCEFFFHFIYLGDNSDFLSLSGNNQATAFSNGSLYIESIKKEDEGMYKCNISNGIGNSLIKTVMVKVIGMWGKTITFA